ncbi:hypothetical protein K438DRAFT_1782401 [Mycena galopus ATCC 62051]|nr:hypothetical protein K438DRAFT_1782401 [Mycena galopus ATCC 62051]
MHCNTNVDPSGWRRRRCLPPRPSSKRHTTSSTSPQNSARPCRLDGYAPRQRDNAKGHDRRFIHAIATKISAPSQRCSSHHGRSPTHAAHALPPPLSATAKHQAAHDNAVPANLNNTNIVDDEDAHGDGDGDGDALPPADVPAVVGGRSRGGSIGRARGGGRGQRGSRGRARGGRGGLHIIHSDEEEVQIQPRRSSRR